MKVREVRELSPEDMTARINDTRREIVSLRFQMAAHKLESPTKLRLARRSLSRLLTIQTQVERNEVPAPMKDVKPTEAKDVKPSKKK